MCVRAQYAEGVGKQVYQLYVYCFSLQSFEFFHHAKIQNKKPKCKKNNHFFTKII